MKTYLNPVLIQNILVASGIVGTFAFVVFLLAKIIFG